MENFNYTLLNQEIKKQYKNNKKFQIALSKVGVIVGEEAIKKWRQGNSAPKTFNIAIICKLLNIDLYELFFMKPQNTIS